MMILLNPLNFVVFAVTRTDYFQLTVHVKLFPELFKCTSVFGINNRSTFTVEFLCGVMRHLYLKSS